MSLASTLAQTFETKNEKLAELRIIVDACPLAMFISDDQGNCLYVNQAYQALAGRGWQDALGDRWKQSIHPDDVEEVTERWDASVAHRETFDLAYRYLLPTGDIIPVHCHAVKLPSGGFVGYVNAADGINCAFSCAAKTAYRKLLASRK